MSNVEQIQVFNEISQIISQYKEEITGKRKMWPKALRKRIEMLRSSGVSVVTISEKVGIPYSTLHSWNRRSTMGKFKRVKVSESKSLTVRDTTVGDGVSQTIKVTTVGGLTVEGLSFEQVASLLRGGV